MVVSDWSLLITAAVGAFAVIGTVVATALRLQRGIAHEFRTHRRLMYRLLHRRDRAILRMEYYLVRTSNGEFQPTVDPPEAGNNNGNGYDGGN